MNINFLDKETNFVLQTINEPENYYIPNNTDIIESTTFTKNENFEEEKKRIHINGIYINFYKRSVFKKREVIVQSDSEYIQIHFEISKGSTNYLHYSNNLNLSTKTGEYNFFYLPLLDGLLVDNPCTNSYSVEIEISKTWIINNLANKSKYFDDFLVNIENSKPSLLGNNTYKVSPNIIKILSEINNPLQSGAVKQLFIEAKLIELLAYIFYEISTDYKQLLNRNFSKHNIDQIHFIKDKIKNDIHINYSIEELAIIACMNRTKLQAGFKSIFGLTIHEFIVEERLKLAHKFLSESYSNYWNISEIANKVGYKRSNHFSTAYKKKYGVSPNQYIKNKIV